MSHPRQREFVRLVATGLPAFFHKAKVLEVGSLNINGSVREFFTDCDYLGLDVGAGPDVDLVCEGQRYDAPDHTFDQVISCEAMEHNPFFQETFRNMIRMCKPGGLITLTCATTGRPEHGTARSEPGQSPLTVDQGWNYYRNLTRRDFAAAGNLEKDFVRHRFWTNWLSFDLYFIGLKQTDSLAPELAAAWENTVRAIDGFIAESNRSRMCMFRAGLAHLAGDRGFDFMRKRARDFEYIHRVHY